METTTMCNSLDELIGEIQSVEKKYVTLQKHVDHPSLKQKLRQFVKDRKRFKRGLQYCLRSLRDVRKPGITKQKQSAMKIGVIDNSIGLHPDVVIKEALQKSKEVEKTYSKVLKENSFPPRIAQLLMNQRNKIMAQRSILMGYRNELGYIQS